MIFIVISHVGFVTPSRVYATIVVFFPDFWSEMSDSARTIFFCISHIMIVANYSINFLLYCVANKQVRAETWDFLFRCKNLYWSRE